MEVRTSWVRSDCYCRLCLLLVYLLTYLICLWWFCSQLSCDEYCLSVKKLAADMWQLYVWQKQQEPQCQYVCDDVSCWWYYDPWQHCIDRLQCVLAAAWHVVARMQSVVACEGHLWNCMCRVHLATHCLCRVRCGLCDTSAVARLRSQYHQCNHLSLLHSACHLFTSQNDAYWSRNVTFSQ